MCWLRLPVDRLRFGGDGLQYGRGRPCIAGESWRWPGGQVFQFLSPALETTRSSNDSSCVLQIEVGDYRFLLPGDIDSERERTLVRYWGETLQQRLASGRPSRQQNIVLSGVP